ncbi:septum site-determining protein MinC [Paenibacillus tarimensis]|uniref:septum site-determining protein MinC n=1 Tax=Paenibacillus tarimensis TaxID=416012 RepID=UPI001F35D1D2|nr:septum site-determining protein MinC [Paenibacillus tarimensis]MCF2943952.1 septum site-determining protein MinC [Paenibacillus tarimensis]
MTEKQHITIKGVKEGLVFLLDDSCDFGELLDELHYKLETTHQQLLTGPLVHVQVKLGSRRASEEEKERIVSVIRQRGNLLVQSVDGEQDEELAKAVKKDDMKVMTGVVRSGQTIRHEGNIMLMGDVNPGGTIMSTGDIYVLGALRGLAHAGIDGRRDVIIASSMLRPTQLRIADIISRPPDEWMTGDTFMEFAYLQEGQMKIDKLSQLHRLRKDPIVFKGV